jgi:hypothetical protein
MCPRNMWPPFLGLKGTASKNQHEAEPQIPGVISEHALPLFIILVQLERDDYWRKYCKSVYKRRDRFCNGLTFCYNLRKINDGWKICNLSSYSVDK